MKAKGGEGRFEVLDHPADVRVRLRGADPADLLASGAAALAHLLVGDADVPARRSVTIDQEVQDLEEGLIVFLNELVYRASVEGAVLPEVITAKLAPPVLQAEVRGCNVEEAGVHLHTEIKAATYSGLEIEEGEGGVLRAEVIFDV